MKKPLFLLLLSLPLTPLAQTTRWELSLTGSYMTPNNFNMLEYATGAVGAEVGWWSRCEGDQWWVQRRKNPSFGLRASVALIPQGIAGHRLGMAGLVKAPLWKDIDYHIGLGLSLYTRSKYFSHDPENIFITTLINCLIDIGLDYRLSDRLAASFSMLHSSNGMLNRPNKGLNFLQLGMTYRLTGTNPRNAVHAASLPDPPAFDRHEVGFALQGGAVMSWDLRQDGHYPCYDVSLNYQYYFDPLIAVGGTLDFWYNGTHYGLSRMYGECYTFPCYVSMLGFVEGFWGPLSLKAGIGPVLVAPPRVNIRFYERVGAYYNFRNNYLGIALNAHAGVIEFIELCYGHRFKLRTGRQ